MTLRRDGKSKLDLDLRTGETVQIVTDDNTKRTAETLEAILEQLEVMNMHLESMSE